MSDIRTLYAQSVETFASLVGGIPPDAWSRPTPCTEWDVRALVNHVVGEDRWTVPLLEGRTIEEVGDRFEGDLLGSDPAGTSASAAKEAVWAFSPDDAMRRVVHVSFGDIPAEEYAWQLFADHLVHGWDLAVATGQQHYFDPELVGAAAGWFAEHEEEYRSWGVIADRVEVGDDATEQDRLIAAFGRDPDWQPPS